MTKAVPKFCGVGVECDVRLEVTSFLDNLVEVIGNGVGESPYPRSGQHARR